MVHSNKGDLATRIRKEENTHRKVAPRPSKNGIAVEYHGREDWWLVAAAAALPAAFLEIFKQQIHFQGRFSCKHSASEF